MVKFLRAALLPLVLLCLVSGTASAGARYVERVVPIRSFTTAAAAIAAGGVAFQYLGTSVPVHYVDSTSFYHNSSAGQAALVADTSAWFSLPDRAFAPFVLGADSLSLLGVSVRPTYFRSNAVAADSFGLTLQASFNGIDVVAGVLADVVEVGSSNCFWKTYQWTRGATAATTTNLNIGMFPLYRVIVTDFTGTTGDFELGVSYWKDVVAGQ